MLRRNYTYQDENLQMAHRQLIFNLSNSSIQYGNQTTELSRNDFIILQTLMRNIGKIVSRDELMQVLWNDEQFVDDNTLTVNVNRLRRKVALLSMEDFIATRKGMGYIIE
ncbi:Response regulator protein GraR [compost metagenome]